MIIDVTLIISFLVLVSTSTTLFNYFKCHTFYEAQGGKESYLYLDYSISCLSPRYQGYIAYAVIMIGVYPIGSNFIVPHILHSRSLSLSNSYILFTTYDYNTVPLLYYTMLHLYKDILSDQEKVEEEELHG
jgi:hypothetical protein